MTGAGSVVEKTIELPRDRLKRLPKRLSTFVVLYYLQSPESGAISRDFTIDLSPQCRAFTRALHLKI